ncbi:MAG TPA: two-component regulator propeller domain-containing protein, partial [Blastocatellia bacterium]|nr:two-component regulator propeller domain-containing protein [Blastocatellia bacterium]
MRDGHSRQRSVSPWAVGIVLNAAVIVCLSTAERALAAPPASGQTQNYGIDFWREADGLPQSRIRAIAQTRDGYLWLGTDNGLFRFNGAIFISFTVETGSLRDNEVSGLQEDDEGGLWIGTYGGGLSLLKNGTFRTFTTADGLPDDVVTRLDKDQSGGIWIATRKGVCCYAQGNLTRLPINNVPPDSAVTAISAASQQGIFVASGEQLYQLVKRNFEPVRGVVERGDGVIDSLMAARDGSLWIGLHNGVIKKWKSSSIARYTHRQNVTPHIHRIYEDPQGAVWAAMEHGLYQFRQGRFEPVTSADDQARLGVVYSLCTDREGSLWLGLESNGLARLRPKQLTTITTGDGLPNDSTRSVFQDGGGNTWIGTANGFASIRQGRVTTYNYFEGARIGTVRSFTEDNDGNIWIGAGPDLLLLKAGRLKRCTGWKNTAEIKVLYRDRGGRIWVGTDGDGIFVFDGGRITHLTSSDGLAANQIRSILQDRGGALWIATFGGGISKYANGRFATYTTDDGLAANRVLAIHEDDEGSLWFATRKGLSRFKGGRFFNFTAENGLPASTVYSILDDGQGCFWFTGAQGLFTIKKVELTDLAEGKTKRVASVDFGVRDGMLTRAFNAGNQPAAWKAENGSLMFCSMKGIIVADPVSASPNVFVPPVYIESVAVNKEAQPLDRGADAALGSG